MYTVLPYTSTRTNYVCVLCRSHTHWRKIWPVLQTNAFRHLGIPHEDPSVGHVSSPQRNGTHTVGMRSERHPQDEDTAVPDLRETTDLEFQDFVAGVVSDPCLLSQSVSPFVCPHRVPTDADALWSQDIKTRSKLCTHSSSTYSQYCRVKCARSRSNRTWFQQKLRTVIPHTHTHTMQASLSFQRLHVFLPQRHTARDEQEREVPLCPVLCCTSVFSLSLLI